MNTSRYYYKLILKKYILPILGKLLGYYIKFVYKTAKIIIIQEPEIPDFFNNPKSALYAFWHGRLLMISAFYAPHKKMKVLVSKNEIGILADYCVRLFNVGLIRGSARNPNKPDNDKGGTVALKEILRSLKQGYSVGITPDGPLGPRQKVHKGIIMAAILSQKPIIALTYTCKHAFYAKSWDRFLIPLPFSRIYYKASAPLYIPKDTTEENIALYTKLLETQMNSDIQELDAL